MNTNSINAEAVFMKVEMNNERNVKFLQNILTLKFNMLIPLSFPLIKGPETPLLILCEAARSYVLSICER